MIYFYANNTYMGKAKLTSFDAQKIIKNMNMISLKLWRYSSVKESKQ